MAMDGANDPGESRRRIIIDNVIYEPVNSVAASRQQRSQVFMYDDSEIRRMEPYRYKPLCSMRRRLRLLRLHGGALSNPEITCELFEVEYGKNDQNKVKRVLSKDERSVMHESRERHHSRPKKRDRSTGNQAADLDGDVIEYEALSWCWGQVVNDRAIRIVEGGKYYRLAVTRDLFLALKYLRRPHEERILWIDALCINQGDHEERNHQVQMMSRIYSGARQVCIWLGDGSDDSAKAMAFIQEIMKLDDFDAISKEKEEASLWQSLMFLMQRPWFSRRWVVQEIALAKSATIYCGNDKIPWTSFVAAVELFVEIETATHRLSELMRKDSQVPRWFEHISTLGASVLVQATGTVFRRDGNPGTDAEQDIEARPRKRARKNVRAHMKGSQETYKSVDISQPPTPVSKRPLLGLEYLVSSLFVFQATQPRDAVYSLLAIARDAVPFAEAQNQSQEGCEEAIMTSVIPRLLVGREPFKIDYSCAYSEVCRDFVSFCIQTNRRSDPTRALDILCRPWAPEPKVTAGGVVHRKPTSYKYLPSNKRECLWPVGRKPDQRFRFHGSDIAREVKESAQRIGPIMRREDTRSTAEYWKDCDEDWKRNGDGRALTFERDVKPFLPNRKKLLMKAAEDRRQRSSSSERSESGEESVGSDDEEQNQEDEDIPLPSWVSRITEAPFALYRHPGMRKSARIGRMNADPLVGLPQDGRNTYSASLASKWIWDSCYQRVRFRKRPKSRHHSLFTEGFILTEIDNVAEPARLGAIPETWTRLAGWVDAADGQTDPPVEFWRTLVANRGKDGRDAPYYYATACRESVRKGGLQGGSVDTGALINIERNPIIVEFCRRVQAVIWNRCLIKTKQPSNLLGLVNQQVKKGDLVCILFGCTVPVILRKFRKAPGDLEEEQMQDRIESMKAAMRVCEEACFRKLRYQKRLQKERQKGKHLEELWKEEVLEDMKDVNVQIERWREREKEEELKREQTRYEEQDIRKKNEERRHAIAEKRRAALTPQRPQNGSIAMPSPRLGSMATESASISVDAGRTDESERVGSTHTLLSRVQKQDRQDGVEDTNQSTPEHMWDERLMRMKESKEEDPSVYYQFMGEAYIHGMMDGEAVRLHMNEGIPRRLFEIR